MNKLPENENTVSQSSVEKTTTQQADPVNQKKSGFRITTCTWIFAVVMIGLVVLGAAFYYGTGYVFASQVEDGYTKGDCTKAAEIGPVLEKFYPHSIAPFMNSISDISKECLAYMNAVQNFEQQKWSAAYDDYKSFLVQYPSGPLSTQAREGAAASLYEWAEYQFNQGKYQHAISNYKTFTREFGSSPQANRARLRISEAYIGWARYLMNQEIYPTAAEKLQLAIDSDPNAESLAGPASSARAMLPELHHSWGDTLIGAKNFSQAIEHYSLAVSFCSGDEINPAKDVLAQGYLQWAAAVQLEKDFYEAFDLIDEAQEHAASPGVIAEVDETWETTLNVFANSTGEQAHELMDAYAKSVCESGKSMNTLPVIGIDDSRIRIYFEGVNADFSNAVTSQRPASMHYVACISRELKTIQSCPYTGSKTGNRYTINRKVVHWIIQVKDAVTGNSVGTEDFAGKPPKACPKSASFRVGQSTVTYTGSTPSTETVENWLQSILK